MFALKNTKSIVLNPWEKKELWEAARAMKQHGDISVKRYKTFAKHDQSYLIKKEIKTHEYPGKGHVVHQMLRG